MDDTQRKITKIAREAAKFTVQTMKAEGIGTAEFDFIHLVRHKPGITQAEIRETLKIDKGAAARRAASLEAKGYLVRKPNPEDKRSQLLFATEKAEELKKDGLLMYVGDGINDAPVMAVADCSVSMGKLGSAAAVEASDLVLVSDNLRAIPKCVRIARKTRKIVTENIVFSIAMKAAFMILAAMGIMPLWLAVFADVGVMLLAVLNSLRMRLKIKD